MAIINQSSASAIWFFFLFLFFLQSNVGFPLLGYYGSCKIGGGNSSGNSKFANMSHAI